MDEEEKTLTCALFNDVWVHQFQKAGFIGQAREAGFRRVDMKDGFGYHRYWIFD